MIVSYWFIWLLYIDVSVFFFVEDLCDMETLICRRDRLPGVSFPSANADRFDDEAGAFGLGKWMGWVAETEKSLVCRMPLFDLICIINIWVTIIWN